MSKLSSPKYVTNSYSITEKFSNIKVDTGTAAVIFNVSDDGIFKVECYENEKRTHKVGVSDGTLYITEQKAEKWYHNIFINLRTTQITVYLPAGEYGALSIDESTGKIVLPRQLTFESVDAKISTGDFNCDSDVKGALAVEGSTGDVKLDLIKAGSLDICVSTGAISISNVQADGDVKFEVSTGKTIIGGLTCKNFSSTGDTGDILLRNVFAEKMNVERSTGNVTFDGSDALEIYVKTDTGDVRGSFMTDKIFFAKSDTGRVEVPMSTSGGKCTIETDTGNIIVGVK